MQPRKCVIYWILNHVLYTLCKWQIFILPITRRCYCSCKLNELPHDRKTYNSINIKFAIEYTTRNNNKKTLKLIKKNIFQTKSCVFLNIIGNWSINLFFKAFSTCVIKILYLYKDSQNDVRRDTRKMCEFY